MRNLTARLSEPKADGPMVELDLPASGRNVLKLLDYATAGENGRPYRTWLPIDHAVSTEYSSVNTLRTTRLAQ